MVGVLIVVILSENYDFDTMAAGISALLGWITIILVPKRRWSQHVFGLAVYLVVGAALTWLAYIVEPYVWVKLISMALVTFAGYMLLLLGTQTFVVGWCLVYWFLLVPLFIGGQNLPSLLLAHLIGAGIVIVLNLLKPVWWHAVKKVAPEPGLGKSSDKERPQLGFVVGYASIVSLTIFTGLAAGLRWITSDPTLIANATLNMIAPSFKQTWMAAVERIILGTLGVVGGFYCGWFFPNPWVGYLVVALSSFLALGVIYVNLALCVGILFFLLSYPWGVMQSDAGHLLANEKLISELVGVLLAVVAIALLTRLQLWLASLSKN